MKTYIDNFNMSKGYERKITEYITIGKNTLLKTVVKKEGIKNRITWEHKIDTRNAPYPSLACIIGAVTCSTTSQKFFPIFISFIRAIIL